MRSEEVGVEKDFLSCKECKFWRRKGKFLGKCELKDGLFFENDGCRDGMFVSDRNVELYEGYERTYRRRMELTDRD